MSRIDELKNDVRRHPDWAAHKLLKHEQQNAELSELLAHAVSVADAIDTGEPPPDDDDFVRWLKNSKALLARPKSTEGERDE